MQGHFKASVEFPGTGTLLEAEWQSTFGKTTLHTEEDDLEMLEVTGTRAELAVNWINELCAALDHCKSKAKPRHTVALVVHMQSDGVISKLSFQYVLHVFECCRLWSCWRSTSILAISMKQCGVSRNLTCHISTMNLSIRYCRLPLWFVWQESVKSVNMHWYSTSYKACTSQNLTLHNTCKRRRRVKQLKNQYKRDQSCQIVTCMLNKI